jgi:hypothetical protein
MEEEAAGTAVQDGAGMDTPDGDGAGMDTPDGDGVALA